MALPFVQKLLRITCLCLSFPGTLLACIERAEDPHQNWFIGFHQGAFERMMVTRGAPAASGYWPVTLQDIQDTLKLTPQNEILLLYAERSDIGICLVAIDESGVRASADTGLWPETYPDGFGISDPGETSLEVFRLHAELGVVTRQAARAAVLLDEERVIENLADPQVDGQTQNALSIMSGALIPEDIAPILTEADEILILPVYGIATVPFPLLKVDDRMLLDIAPVTIVPSITSFAENQDGQMVPPPLRYTSDWMAPAIFGDPESPPTETWRFPPLPGARAEAWSVASVLRRTPIVGKEVTRAAVLDALSGDTDFFYLATHGISDPQDPLNGFVTLADGHLYAHEIQALDLRQPALVVLSACQTGLGQSHQAGIIGVSRGFILAGAGAVVMSLWNVDDEATAQLMRRFAARVGEERPSRALRHAMLEMRERYPDDPALWAGFVVLGNVSLDASGH